MLGQAFLAFVPLVKTWWIRAALWLGETLEIDKEVIWVGVGEIVEVEKEGEGGEDEEDEEGGTETTGNDRTRTTWGRELFLFLFLEGDRARERQAQAQTRAWTHALRNRPQHAQGQGVHRGKHPNCNAK